MSTAEISRSIFSFRGMRLAAQGLLALLAMAGVGVAASDLAPERAVPTTALVYLIIVVVLSLNGSFVSAAVVSLAGAAWLAYFFGPPLSSLGSEEPLEGIALFAYLTAALVVTRLVTKIRNSLETLRTSVAARMHAEAATERQAALLHLTHDTVFVRDLSDVITFWNRGAEELYGWAAEEVLGRVTHDLLRTEFPAPLEEITAELHRTGRWEGELVHRRRDGTNVVVASRWALERAADGRPLAILETNNDVTARKRADEALQRSQTELAHVARVTTLGELAASIAHEINQPLTAIITGARAGLNWLARPSPDLPRVEESLSGIARDGERAAEIVSRIRGLLSPQPQSFVVCDLSDAIRNVLPFVRSECARHGIGVQAALPDEETQVMGDCIQLQQVLLNLLLNAAEASKEVPQDRRVLVVSARSERTGSDPRVLVEVRDSGVGIRETDLAAMFQAFHTTKPGGLGMGLSISRSIVERHGGQLWASANSDHGATFRFWLPALP